MMSLKKKRTIIIKDPHLRKIRNNLRVLILKASRSIQHQILANMNTLKNDIDEFFNRPELMQKNKDLEKKRQKIEQQLSDSIILCPSCLKSNKDMTFNPVRKTWYCTECYEFLKQRNEERGTPEEFP